MTVKLFKPECYKIRLKYCRENIDLLNKIISYRKNMGHDIVDIYEKGKLKHFEMLKDAISKRDFKKYADYNFYYALILPGSKEIEICFIL